MEKIKKETYIQTIKFFAISASAALIEIISFFIFRKIFKMNIELSQAISIILSVIYNFTVNRKYTFKSNNNYYLSLIKASLFYLFFIPFSAYGSKLLEGLKVNDIFIKTASLLINGIGEFLWFKYFVFRNKNKTSD